MHARRMVVAKVALWTLFVSVWTLPDAAVAAGLREPAKPHAEMAVGASRVDWQPAGDYEHLTLTVAGPAGIWIRKEFAGGQPASLSLVDQNGQALPEGAYAYELRLVSRKEGNLPERSLLQAGSFAVRAGSFAAAFEEIEPPTRKAPAPIKADQDKVVTPANACFGALCVAGDDAGPPILRLKDYTGVGIFFNDITDSFSYSRDWLLQANPNPFTGGLQSFFLQDLDAATIPFSVQGQAPDYSLVVGGDSVSSGIGGNIGVGTAIPAKAVHVARTDTPTLRLEDTYTGALPGIRIWDIGANATELFVKDVTGSSNVPFRIKAGAPGDSLVVNSTGQIGIGTGAPAASLHVVSGEVRIPGGTASTNGWPTHFRWPSDGRNYIRGATVIADDGGSVAIGTQTAASGAKLTVNGGNVHVVGGAFVDDGTTLNAPDYVFEPDYKLMPLADLAAYVQRERHLPNVPSATEIKANGLNLSQFQMRLLEKIEELALYTLQQEEGLKSLRDENRALAARLETLEAQTSGEPQ